jgi:hypothetical protein
MLFKRRPCRPQLVRKAEWFAGLSVDFYAGKLVPASRGNDRIGRVAYDEHQLFGLEQLREFKIIIHQRRRLACGRQSL